MKTLSVAAVAALCSLSAFASANDTYRYEVGAGYLKTDIFDFSYDTLMVGGRVYFDEVSTNGVPRSEAGFYHHTSHAEIAYATSDDIGVDSLNANVTYFVPNTMIMLGAGITDTSYSGGGSDNAWNLRLGVAPSDGLLLWTEINEDVDYSDNINVNAEYVTPLNNGTAFKLEGALARLKSEYGDSATSFTVAGDYFFTQDTSLGLMASLINATDDDLTGFGVRGQHFFTPQLTLEANYFSYEGDLDTFTLVLSYRF